MKEHSEFYLLPIILFLYINSGSPSCTMPVAWLGSWYQSGMNSLLEITIDHIQTKGTCLDVLESQHYYLFTDRPNRCTRCLVFIQRHINLLQYRESECNDADDLFNITSCPNTIAPDAALYTLHRNNSKPQLCPIQPPFHLLNLTKDSSVCSQSLASSYIHQCANDYQFHLYLMPCSPYQPILDLQFVCVGTWVEDFHTYFVARLDSQSEQQHLNSHRRRHQYACFRYLTKQKSSTILSLSMATDDSCRDLYSKHMSTVMTLSSKKGRQIHHDLVQTCSFPKRVQLHQWYSINETIRMFIKNNDIEFIHMNKRFHCQELLHSDKSTSIYRIKSYTNCQIKDECLRIVQRSDNVIELYTSEFLNDNTCDFFQNDNFDLYLTFFTKTLITLNNCPMYINDLIIQSNLDFNLSQMSYRMSMDCNKRQQLTNLQTEADAGNRFATEYNTCLASWSSDDRSTMYFIAQSRYSNEIYCLNFRMTDSIQIRNNKDGCSFTNDVEEKHISIYSTRMESLCSQAQKLLSTLTFVLIMIAFSIISTK